MITMHRFYLATGAFALVWVGYGLGAWIGLG